MRSPNPHVIAERFSRLAGDVEQAFFRMERANRWQAAVVNGVMAGAAVAVVAWLLQTLQEGDLLLFACLGSSAAAVVFAPLARSNSLRTILAAYMIACIVCLALTPVHRGEWLPISVQCFLAVAVPVALMRLTDTMHPAAIGSALAFMIYDRPPQQLVLLLLAMFGLLTVVKVLAYIYLEELQFRRFRCEFRREFYGRELLVTVPDREVRSLQDKSEAVVTTTEQPHLDGSV